MLIVEDDDTTRRTLRQFFERRSCRVVECSSGAEGIFVYLQNPNVDVVVLDLKLPFLTGFSFIEVVQELSRLGRIPTKRNIIVNSAYLQYDDLEKLARYSTVLAIRRKPFNPHLFERDLERIRDKANLAAVLRGG